MIVVYALVLLFINALNPMKLDAVVLNNNNIITSFKNKLSKVPGILLFYKKSDDIEQYIDKVYNKIAADYKGIAIVGIVNCDQHSSLCMDELGSKLEKKSKKLRIYPILPIPSYEYSNFDRKKIISELMRQIKRPSIPTVTIDTCEDFFKQDPILPKAIYFTNKKMPLSLVSQVNLFENKILFSSSNDTSLAAKLGVTKDFPQLIVKRGNTRLTKQGVTIFNEEFTSTNLNNFLNIFSETFGKGGGFDDTLKNYNFQVNKEWLKEDVPELTRASYNDVCFKLKNNFCLVYVTDKNISNNQKSILKKTIKSKNLSKYNLKPSWLNVSIEKNFNTFLTPNEILFIKPKKGRYISSNNGDLSEKSILELFELVEAGTAFKKFKHTNFISRIHKQNTDL